MSALCAAQENRASTAPASATEKRDGANPFNALRNFFGRVLPAQVPAPVAASAPAATPEPAPTAAPAAESAAEPASAAVPAADPLPVAAPSGVLAPASSPAAARSGIALLLPTRAPAFARAADATRAGFVAARNASKSGIAFTLVETDGSPERARAAYREAAAKALVVVGPLTRSEVGALIGELIPVPTLVLNLPDLAAGTNAVPLPPQMRALALNIEHEAQSAAHAAYAPDAQVAVVVVATDSVLQKRAAAAFTDAWIRLGGQIGNPIEFSGALGRVRQGIERARADVVFLASDAATARLVRPYLGRGTVVIATSQVYSGPPKSEAQKFHDLNGIRFIDMPWLHHPDRAALGFALPETPLSPDLERLYALGIDAYRVASELVRGNAQFELDGVTGKLRGQAGSLEREPIQAEFRDGDVSLVR